jgi:hypothetical protein
MENVGNIGFPNVEQMEIHRLVRHNKVIGMYCFFGVPIVFSKGSSSSQRVFSTCSQSTTLLSHMLWPKLNFHIYIYGCAQYCKKVGDGSMKMALGRRIRKKESKNTK